jgi:ADP-heptose:LPS heptosyltransferase
MTLSRRMPNPVPVRAYRYSRLRWRVLVRVFDTLGGQAMRLYRQFRPTPTVESPRRILVVQLDHLGDAVLSSPLFPRLRTAYPDARIDVLASASNHAAFEADPQIDRVFIAERNWFERRPGGWSLGSAVWKLGSLLRAEKYDLGIDVRGDILTVLVMSLAGIPRRAGWAMGGGGFLLTDIADWIPNRHEVHSRLALLERLGISDDDPPRVLAHIEDRDRARIGTWLRTAWPDRASKSRSAKVRVGIPHEIGAPHRPRGSKHPLSNPPEAEWLHAGRFGDSAPLLAVHLGAGTAAKRWPKEHWRTLIEKFLGEGWRVVIVGGSDDTEAARLIPAHPNLRDWTGRLQVTETSALLERADLFIGADSGPAHLAACAGVTSVILFSGTNRASQWRPWSRRSLVLRHDVPCRPCHHKICPLADHPCMTGLTPERVHSAAKRWWSRVHHAESPHAPLS